MHRRTYASPLNISCTLDNNSNSRSSFAQARKAWRFTVLVTLLKCFLSCGILTVMQLLIVTMNLKSFASRQQFCENLSMSVIGGKEVTCSYSYHGFNSSSLGRRARSLLWLHRLDRQRGVFLCLRCQNLQSNICCFDISNCVQVHKVKQYSEREALVCYID